MDSFYTSVLIGALVLLIVILIVVGVVMMKLQASDSYPPTYATCPDYWDVSANPDYCGVYVASGTGKNQGEIVIPAGSKKIDTTNPKNVGMCSVANKFGCKSGASEASSTADSTHYIPTGAGFDANSSQFQYLKLNNNNRLNGADLFPGTTDRCAKKRWADTMGITWDGVTNFNGC